jgi:hypothetical protein
VLSEARYLPRTLGLVRDAAGGAYASSWARQSRESQIDPTGQP